MELLHSRVGGAELDFAEWRPPKEDLKPVGFFMKQKGSVDTQFHQHTECARTHGSQTDRRAARPRRPIIPAEQTCQTGFLGFVGIGHLEG